MGGWGEPQGRGFYVMEDGSRHEGEFKNGRPVGWGIFTWTNGQRYEGEWRDGRPHGPGIFTWRDGKRYEGETLDGKQSGKGKFTWPSGESYSGDFENGMEHGLGLFTSADGSHFCGNFSEGKGFGHVVVRFSDGSAFEGTWNGSSIDGYGVSYTADSVYAGQLRSALPSGVGEMLTAKGMKYSGSWADGVRNGLGVYRWPDGSEYRGGFADGAQDGCGVQATPGLLYGKSSLVGTWERGVLAPNTTQPPSTGHASEGLGGGGVDCEAGAPEVESLLASVAASEAAAQAGEQDAQAARTRALRIARAIPECAQLGLAPGDADVAMARVAAAARDAVRNADTPQVWAAILLGTLMALTLWVVYILITWPSAVADRAAASGSTPAVAGSPAAARVLAASKRGAAKAESKKRK